MQSEVINQDVASYLKEQENKELLRFITCGSVDDGKSTLIGRLLWDTKLIFEDQLQSLENTSKKFGTQGDNIDYALLLDGLQAEQEQGITIDVAYRFFTTDKRKFIVADTPGHKQYTRNMATGASTADVAVILIDATKGVLPQTKRHSLIVSLMGIKKVLLAINKMDLVNYNQETFSKIKQEYQKFAQNFAFEEIACIPISALNGTNVVNNSDKTKWYKGPSFLGYLENVKIDEKKINLPFRMPVQWVNRPNHKFRGFSGTIVSGSVKKGDDILVVSSGKTSRVKDIVTFDGSLNEAIAGQSITIVLEDEIDISKGDVLSEVSKCPIQANQFQAQIVWLDEKELLPERPYFIKLGTTETSAQITELKYRLNVNTMVKESAKTLQLNEIGCCNVFVYEDLAFDVFKDNPNTGRFILIDKISNNTVGAGIINYELRRSTNVHWQHLDVNKTTRANQKKQKPFVLWFTGLSGSGKSTIANIIEKKLLSENKHTYLLDGDNIRHGLNKDLGFTDVDRVENIRRIAEVSKLMIDAGLIVITAFISPFKSEREMARSLLEDGEFLEIWIKTPIEICEKRDVKGLYKKAREGKIPNFTGISAPYEKPKNSEIIIDGSKGTAEEQAQIVFDYLLKHKYL
ncbi:MAG: sulfate adenylyltransferase subunit CysN [Alphaproteobacteria bacterium]